MQVRRRPFPLDFHTASSVRAGQRPDPRKGPKEGRGTHAPKMQPNRSTVTLYVGGISHEVIAEERAKAAADREPRTVTLLIPSTDKAAKEKRVIPFARYGRETAKLRAEGFKVPYGDGVSPGATVQVSA